MDGECHSPRPFTERQICTTAPDIYNYPNVVPYTNDPVHLFECSNSSPYPMMNKTDIKLLGERSHFAPSNDLELSILDATEQDPRKSTLSRPILKPSGVDNVNNNMNKSGNVDYNKLPIISSTANNIVTPPNILSKDDFFLKRGNLGRMHLDMNPIQQQLNRLCIDKENNPFAQKAQIIQMSALTQPEVKTFSEAQSTIKGDCMCHHCVKNISAHHHVIVDHTPYQHTGNCIPHHEAKNTPRHNYCMCGRPPPPNTHSCCEHTPHPSQCTFKTPDSNHSPNTQMTAVEKKTWAIEKYEQNKMSDSKEVEKQTNVIKEKREPTVSDLFKIIKLQNEQLQLLQDKVDKFISNSQRNPVQNCISEQVAIETVANEQHKISIGVMTSFEMVRTSTIINKEVLKTNENSQIQCNRSQISIKEVVSKAQSPNLNFLEGITPVGKQMTQEQNNGDAQHMNEEKTLNELSLYNVQVDNATTPLISPEQSLYLDVRDYSDSEAESDDQSNVGWTYYNKVMTHVNGMLHDSDMPSSASALYRNTRQQMQTVQMQIDKTNVSVTKRVKFGDDPLGIHQPHIYTGSSDTSLKMNQLAAKYLKGATPVAAPPRQPTTTPIDMSFATRNYMDRHKLLQGVPSSSRSPLQPEMPRFLDITALKQQPKFL
ncbi:unnamed protein product [Arctia plantaginis]|uniref:Uncharacterized protein n=1 Tax=Arctia plantaginis TaxID=874455 RepID=A0A8S1BAT8_ARCPL|nr:unnamed protein product [Arctia plantaginis]